MTVQEYIQDYQEALAILENHSPKAILFSNRIASGGIEILDGGTKILDGNGEIYIYYDGVMGSLGLLFHNRSVESAVHFIAKIIAKAKNGELDFDD